MTAIYVASSKLPTPFGEFMLHGFEDSETGQEHVAITLGDVTSDGPVLCRVHSECLTGDALFSMRCDCGAQLQTALQNISDEGRGIILYLRQEGRGIGLINKIRAYELQDQGADTVEANEHLGFDADLRDYSICKAMFGHFQIADIELMTNNPVKVTALTKLGINISKRRPIESGRNLHNTKYLDTKAGKLGHMFSEK